MVSVQGSNQEQLHIILDEVPKISNFGPSHPPRMKIADKVLKIIAGGEGMVNVVHGRNSVPMRYKILVTPFTKRHNEFIVI
jgi:hypothetical protein